MIRVPVSSSAGLQCHLASRSRSPHHQVKVEPPHLPLCLHALVDDRTAFIFADRRQSVAPCLKGLGR